MDTNLDTYTKGETNIITTQKKKELDRVRDW